MSSRDLASLALVKQWLGVTDTSSDLVLGSLISQISAFVYNKTSRDFFLPKSITELYDGRGRDRMIITNWPVQSMQAVYVDGNLVPPAVEDTDSGWLLEPASDEPPGLMQRLDLRGGYIFTMGRKNVRLVYSAGYQVTDEAMTAPASGTVHAGEPYGRWKTSVSVVRASDRSALVQVPSAPTAGQFSVSNSGDYSFSAADAGLQLLVSYGFVPYDLEQAVIEWTAERFKYRDRMGVRSKTLGGAETVSFDISAVPQFVAPVLQTYTRVVSC